MLSGTGNERSVKITPLENAHGSAIVSLDISDGVNTTTLSFTVNVEDVPEPPETMLEDGVLSFIPYKYFNLNVTYTKDNTQPNNGSHGITRFADSKIHYTPHDDYCGSDSFTIDYINMHLPDSEPTGSPVGDVETVTVNVDITCVNDAPRISYTLSKYDNNEYTDEDTELEVTINVIDVDNPASEVAVTMTSANGILFPANNISFTGSGEQKILTLIPAANLWGNEKIDITATDGKLQSSRTITVFVAEVEDSPVITAASAVVFDEDKSATIAVSVSDAETEPGNLIVTLASDAQTILPPSVISLTGSGTERTLSLTPLADQSREEPIAISLTATDEKGNITTHNIAVTVNPVDDLPMLEFTPTANLSGSQPLAVHASATDVDSDITAIEFKLDDGDWQTVSALPFEHTFGALTLGNHSIQARVNTSTGQVVTSNAFNVYVKERELFTANNIPDANNSLATAANNELVGEINGRASVDGGAFSYSVPVVIAPGRSGMQPSIALNYSSQAGQGIAGLGWSLSSYSSISRCSKIYDIDQASNAAIFSLDDKLCYNGSRLIAVNEPVVLTEQGDNRSPNNQSTYGTSGTYYKTERNGSAYIRQLGGDINSQNSYFEITEADGKIHTLGYSANSIIRSLGRTEPSSWLQEKTQDRFGNNIKYAYDTTSAAGNSYLSAIYYTGHGNSTGNRKVEFVYENTDPVVSLSLIHI